MKRYIFLVGALLMSMQGIRAVDKEMETAANIVRDRIQEVQRLYEKVITTGQKFAAKDVARLNTSLVKLLQELKVADDENVKLFEEVFDEFCSALDTFKNFIFKNAIFHGVTKFWGNFKDKLKDPTFLMAAEKHKSNFKTIFDLYKKYAYRYFINEYIKKLDDSKAKSLVDRENFQELMKIMMGDLGIVTYFPTELRDDLINRGLIEKRDFPLIKAADFPIPIDTKTGEVIDAFNIVLPLLQYVRGPAEDPKTGDKRAWPMVWKTLDATHRQDYLNLIERALLIHQFFPSEKQGGQLQQLLPEIKQVNDKIALIPEAQDFLVAEQIPLLYYVQAKTGPVLTPEEVNKFLLDLSVELSALNTQIKTP